MGGEQQQQQQGSKGGSSSSSHCQRCCQRMRCARWYTQPRCVCVFSLSVCLCEGGFEQVHKRPLLTVRALFGCAGGCLCRFLCGYLCQCKPLLVLCLFLRCPPLVPLLVVLVLRLFLWCPCLFSSVLAAVCVCRVFWSNA